MWSEDLDTAYSDEEAEGDGIQEEEGDGTEEDEGIQVDGYEIFEG